MKVKSKKLKVKKNVSLSSLSTFRIGGKVKSFILARTSDELVEAVEEAESRNIKYRVFAGGSNVVFPDEGLDCLLIQAKGGSVDMDGNRVVADAGVSLADIITLAISMGLQGLETLSGIPGTIGGAVFGNAGAYGRSMMESVEKVEILDTALMARMNTNGTNARKWLTNAQCGFEYRHSALKERPCLILRVVLKLKKGDEKRLEKISKDIIKIREKKYRPGIQCPGSFFKNVLVKDVSKKSLGLVDKSKIIEGKIPAGYLLEEVQAKGMREGGVRIADFHGNLLMNTGGGTAKDVKKLAGRLKKMVWEKFGIRLQEEIRYF